MTEDMPEDVKAAGDCEVTESCGCVFCDVVGPPDMPMGGRRVHRCEHIPAGYVHCTRNVPVVRLVVVGSNERRK